MKKTMFALCASVLLVAVSCTKQQTELSGDNLPQKITVLGHARYVPFDKNLAPETPEIVSSGTSVNVLSSVSALSGEGADTPPAERFMPGKNKTNMKNNKLFITVK